MILWENKGTSLNVPISMFNTCNLNCRFCYENKKHNAIFLTKERFTAVREDVKREIVPLVKEHCYNTVLFKFFGGEVFFDAQPDWIYDEYISLLNDIRQMFDIKVCTKFITNGVFTKYDRADRVLDATGSIVGMSYDPVGRYRKEEQRELFKKTAAHFYETGKLKEIATLLTKPAIHAIIEGDDFFNCIPDDIRVDVCTYMPNQNWEELLPSAKDYAEFFQWAIRNKRFNIDRIVSLIQCMIPEERQGVEKICPCNEIIYLPKERRFTNECIERQEFASAYYGDRAKDVTEENCLEMKANLLVKKVGCLYCEHFKWCPIQCAAGILFDKYEQKECPLAKTFASITQEDIDNLKTWRKEHGKNAERAARHQSV